MLHEFEFGCTDHTGDIGEGAGLYMEVLPPHHVDRLGAGAYHGLLHLLPRPALHRPALPCPALLQQPLLPDQLHQHGPGRSTAHLLTQLGISTFIYLNGNITNENFNG